ncbi:MAG: SPOR domain-containing protein [Pseudomonadota bacterium]
MLKYGVVLMVLVNAVYFGIHYDRWVSKRVVDHQANPVNHYDDAPRIKLLGELDTPPTRRTDKDSDAGQAQSEGERTFIEINDESEASQTCYEFGPVTSDPDLEDLLASLRGQTAWLGTQSEVVESRTLYWVFLEPESDAEAQAQVDALAAQGVSDYLRIRRGGLSNAISLGLFRSQDSVARRLAELNEHGYSPVVVPRQDDIQQYWIRAQMLAGFEQAADELGAEYAPINCEEIAAEKATL